MKRFYKDAAAAAQDGGYGVLLDGKRLRTPAKAALVLPTLALAEAIAAEWAAQGERVELPRMPLTRVAATATDRVAGQREAVVAEIVAYGDSDLLCYRAEAPADLVLRQRAAWQPVLDWLAQAHGARLAFAWGIMPVRQAAEVLQALRAAILAGTGGDCALAALHVLAGALGSIALALAVRDGRLTIGQAWAASNVDEAYQAELWGTDPLAVAASAVKQADAEAAAQVLALLAG